MTMNTVFFKEQEGNIAPNGIVHGWNGLGSSAPLAYGESTVVQSKLASLDLSTGVNQFSAVSKDHHEQGLGKGNSTTHFTLFSDYDLSDCKTDENVAKTQVQSSVSSAQAVSMEYRGQLELGFGQPVICAKYPYAEQCYGLYSTYGAQIAGRIMLPLSMTADGGPIFVNAKQYNGIMRRRKKRAELEMDNKVYKSRKPYLHLSRHLHAMRRARGSGGRFLNTKNSNGCNGKTGSKKDDHNDRQPPQSTESQISEVLQSDTIGTYSKGTTYSSRSTSPGTEVTSHLFSLHPFQINQHLHPSFQPFPNVGPNNGLMAAGSYLKV